MPKTFHVMLTDQQRSQLQHCVSAGKSSARKILHAHVLLKADSSSGAPAWSDSQIAQAFGVSVSTVERIRKRFHHQGCEAALVAQKPNRVYSRKIDEHAEKVLIAASYTDPPAGRLRWTVRLLADKLVELHLFDSVSHETVRQAMKKKRAQAVAGRAVGHSS